MEVELLQSNHVVFVWGRIGWVDTQYFAIMSNIHKISPLAINERIKIDTMRISEIFGEPVHENH